MAASSDTRRTPGTTISLLWIGIGAEPLAAVDASRAAALASTGRIPLLLEYMARRIAAIGTPESIAVLVEDLGRIDDSGKRLAILDGIDQAFPGRRQVAMPPAWPKVFRSLTEDSDSRVRARSVTLALIFGDREARASLRHLLSNGRADVAVRREALVALLKVKEPTLAATMHMLVTDRVLGGIAGADCPPTTIPRRPVS